MVEWANLEICEVSANWSSVDCLATWCLHSRLVGDQQYGVTSVPFNWHLFGSQYVPGLLLDLFTNADLSVEQCKVDICFCSPSVVEDKKEIWQSKLTSSEEQRW